MNDAAHPSPMGDFDGPWRRLPWILPAALILWALLLGAFARLLEQAPPPAGLKPIEARLVEVPPAVAGLQGGRAGAAPAAAPPTPKLKPHRVPIHKGVPLVHHKKVARHMERRPVPPPESSSPSGSERAAPAPSSPAVHAGPSSGAKSAGGGGMTGGTGAGTGSGIGGDATGSRAIYAPMPVMPDDLRENALNTVAVAGFHVAADGSAQVTLVNPTAIPRLNSLLLATLKQWRFFPAVKDGKPVASEFELRIPIVVQ